jgi:tungstate transport system permease protein
VGGNIKWHTQVLTTSIVDETQKGNFDFALVLGGILVALALITSIILTIFQRRYVGRKRMRNGVK